MKIAVIFFVICLGAICINAQNVQVVKLPELQQRYLRNNDTTYILNFWATWCGACVKELPEFEKLNQNYKDKKFKMILVSLDFKSDLNKLQSFVSKKQLSAEVILLNETKYNEWIDKIDPSWGGSIPATLVFKNNTGYKQFNEKSLSFEELESIIKPILTQ